MQRITLFDNSSFLHKISKSNPFTKNIILFISLGLIVAFFTAELGIYHQIYFAVRVFLLCFFALHFLVYIISNIQWIKRQNRLGLTTLTLAFVFGHFCILVDNISNRFNEGYWLGRMTRTRFTEWTTFVLTLFSSSLVVFVMDKSNFYKSKSSTLTSNRQGN